MPNFETWLKEKTHKKMEKLEAKITAMASYYFGKDVVIMYIPKEQVKVKKEVKE